MREVNVNDDANVFMLVEKCDLPSKGRRFRVRVPHGFDAVVLTTGEREELLGAGRKDVFSKKHIKSMYFVRLTIAEQLDWRVDNVQGFLFVSVCNSRKLVKKLSGRNISDVRSIIKLLSGRIVSAIKTNLDKSFSSTLEVSEISSVIARELYEVFDEYGLHIERFQINT